MSAAALRGHSGPVLTQQEVLWEGTRGRRAHGRLSQPQGFRPRRVDAAVRTSTGAQSSYSVWGDGEDLQNYVSGFPEEESHLRPLWVVSVFFVDFLLGYFTTD